MKKLILCSFLLSVFLGCKKEEVKTNSNNSITQPNDPNGNGGAGGTGGGGTQPPSTVNDIDGNTYNVIKIGNQFWLKEDLKVTRFKDGTPLNQEFWNNPTIWVSSSTPTFMEVDDSPSPNNVSTSSDGLVYNYTTGTDSRGLCPSGFRVPSKQDIQELLSNYSTSVLAAKALKSTSGWTAYFVGYGSSNPPSLMSGNGNNSSGFNAKPSGYISSNSANYEGIQGNWLVNDNISKDYLSINGFSFFYGDPGSAEIIGAGDSQFHKCRCIYEQ